MKNILYAFLVLLTSFFCINNGMQTERRIELTGEMNSLPKGKKWPKISIDTALKMDVFNGKNENNFLRIEGSFTAIELFAKFLSQDTTQIPKNTNPKNMCEIANIANMTQAKNLLEKLIEYMCQNAEIYKPLSSQLLAEHPYRMFHLKTMPQEEFQKEIVPNKCNNLENIPSTHMPRYYNTSNNTLISYCYQGGNKPITNIKINNHNIEIDNNKNILDIALVSSNKDEKLFLCYVVDESSKLSHTFSPFLLHKISGAINPSHKINNFNQYLLPSKACCLIPNKPFEFFSVEDKKIMYYDGIQPDVYNKLITRNTLYDLPNDFDSSCPLFISTNDAGNIVAVSNHKKIIIITKNENTPTTKIIDNITTENDCIFSATLNHKGNALVVITGTNNVSQASLENAKENLQCILIDTNNTNNRETILLPEEFKTQKTWSQLLNVQFNPSDNWFVLHHNEIGCFYYNIYRKVQLVLPLSKNYTCVSTDCSTILYDQNSFFFRYCKKIPVLDIIKQLTSNTPTSITPEPFSYYKLIRFGAVVTCSAAFFYLLSLLIKHSYQSSLIHNN